MGLNQGRQSQPFSARFSGWLLPAVVIIVALAFGISADSGRESLSYFRPAIARGEVWRLLTGHFVHLGLSHLVLNLAGLMLVWYLVASCLSTRQWLIATAAVLAGVDAGLWVFEPQLQWYVGLSGMLHGMLAAGIVAGLGSARVDIWVLAGILVAKLGYEQIVGPLPGSEVSSGGNVIVASHLYGAIAGGLTALIIRIRVRARASI